MQVMRIKSSIHDYDVNESSSLGEAVENIIGKRKVYAIVDKTMQNPPHAAQLAALDSGRKLFIEATELQKSLENISWIFSWLLEQGFRRDCELLAIGGGVVQDITCFIASVILRGVQWHLIPTTLLAQCDSCIGSKSSINIGRFKNQIGGFYPPNSIELVAKVLETLPADEIRSGLGEAIKLHLLSSEGDFFRLRGLLNGFNGNPDGLDRVIKDCLRIKQRYIEIDEYDKGPRNLLNYGHTFGHAYESATNYAIPHGVAVSLGVATATFISERLGLVSMGHFNEVNDFLKTFYKPYEQCIKALDLQDVISTMKLDKKNTQGTMNCILTRGFGKMEKRSIDPIRELTPLLGEFFQILP